MTNILMGNSNTNENLFNFICENGQLDPMDNPNKHDGSYELTNKILSLYKSLGEMELEKITQNDLFFLLTCTLIRQASYDDTILRFLNFSLLNSKREEILSLFDEVWAKALSKTEYTNSSAEFIGEGKISVGLFSRSEQFRRLEPSDNPKVKNFIKMCIKLSDLDENQEDDALLLVKKYLDENINLGSFHGKASQILHCIKPKFFPILNGPGRKVYFDLGLDLPHPEKFEHYVECCEIIRTFRNINFPEFKNYRVIDFYGSRFKPNETEKIDFEKIHSWLHNYGGKAYRKGDISGKEAQQEFNKFYKLIFTNPNFSNYNSSYWQISGYVMNSFWNKGFDERFKNVKGMLSISLKAFESEGKLKILICLESYNKVIKELTLEERKQINRKLLQEISGAMYLDNISQKSYSYEEALSEIEKDDNYKNTPEYKINPTVYISGPFEKEKTNSIVSSARALVDKFILAYYNMVKGDGETMKNDIKLNSILYGPPGTGKTYNTKIYAVAICNNKSIDEITKMDYVDEVIPEFDRLVSIGRIKFTTFHESYGYEEFVEGIKPIIYEKDGVKNIYYDVRPGIFKKFCEGALSFYKVIGGKNIGNVNFDEKWQLFVEDVEDGLVPYKNIKPNSKNGNKLLYIRSDVNVVIPQGNGLTLTKVNARKFFLKEYFEHDAIDIIREVYKYFAKTYLGFYSIIENDGIDEVRPTVIYEPCVFIIDEINRGKICKIFGELISLIEESKRRDSDEHLSCTLPYSNEVFDVPNNVYILGTMNTADRSIDRIDDALKRRFDFIEMQPKVDLLKDIPMISGLDVSLLLQTMNKRIELLYDREHTIGHSYFMPLKKDPSLKTLSKIFKNNILPLLQEYFYDDYYKIKLVFGNNSFIREEIINNSKYFKGQVEEGMVPEKNYTIDDSAFNDIENYKNII